MEIIKLGKLVDIRKGTKLIETEEIEESIRMIMIGDLRNDDKVKYCIQNDKNIIVNKDDLIIAWDGANAGLVGFNLEGAIGSTLARLSLKCKRTNSDYLGLYLQYKSQEIRDNCTGATIPHVNRNHLTKMNIPVPPIEIQKQIVEVLDEAQRLIDNRKEQIVLLDKLIESIFYDMFGDPAMNDKGWEVNCLGDFYDVKTGKTPRRGVAKYWDNAEINWIKTGEVLNGVINSTSEKISRIAMEELNMYIFGKGDILIAMYGQGNTRGRVSKLDLKATTNQACAGLVAKKDSIINNEYTYNILLLLYEQLRSLGRGGNQPNLNLGIIREYEIPIPPISLQNQFAEKVQAIEWQKELMSQSLKLMEDNYNSLIQRAFKGDLF